MFSIDTKFGDLIVHNENVLNKLSAIFFFIGCFRESSLRNYKESSAVRFTLIHTFSCVLESCECTCVQRLASVQGSFANEWVIKPFLKHPKSSKFVCINSSLQCTYNLTPISLIDFCETFQRIRCVKHFKKKNFRTRLKFDLGLKPLWRHCHVTFIPIAPQNNTIIKLSLSVIHVL